MKMNEILDTIRALARSQGFYGRLLRAILECKESDPDAYEAYAAHLEAQNFRDPIDMVLFFET